MARQTIVVPAITESSPVGNIKSYGYTAIVDDGIASPYTVPDPFSIGGTTNLVKSLADKAKMAFSSYNGGGHEYSMCTTLGIVVDFDGCYWFLKVNPTTYGSWPSSDGKARVCCSYASITSGELTTREIGQKINDATSTNVATLNNISITDWLKGYATKASASVRVRYGYVYAGSSSYEFSVLKTVNVTLNAPSSWVPSFDFAISGSTALVGDKYYVGKSGVSFKVSNISLPGNATKNASQSTIAFQGSTVAISGAEATLTKNPIAQPGTLAATAKVVDSRGRSSTKTLSITAYSHASPTISQFAVRRCDADGSPNEEGTSCAVTVHASAVSDAGAHNLSALTLKWRIYGTSTWSDALDILASNGTELLIPDVEFGTGNQYELVVDATDDAGFKSTATAMLYKAFMTMDFKAGGRGIAFGAPATEDGFHCAMPATFDPPLAGTNLADGAISWGKLAGALQTILNDSKFSSRSMASDLNPLMPGVNTWQTSTKNIPAASTWGIVVTFASGTDPESSGLWRRQVAMDTSGRMFQRQCINQKVSANAGWSSWYQMWTSQGAVPVSGGGTGSTSAAGARTNLGISNCVTAEGNSGIWHYRKYSNGYAEAWCNTTVTVSGMAADNWGWISSSNAMSINFPFTFKTVAHLNVQFQDSAMWAICLPRAGGTDNVPSTSNLTMAKFWAISAGATSGSRRVTVYVCGTY